MSDADGADDTGGGRGGNGDSLSSTIAKWLIPSVGVLFVVVGYIIQTAQEEVLGLGPGDYDTDVYFSNAAAFCQDLVTTLVNSALVLGSRFSMPLNGHHWWLIVITLLAAAVFLLPYAKRLHPKLTFDFARWQGAAVLAVLSLAIISKFVILDAPLTKIQDVILDQNEFNKVQGVSFGRAFADRATDQYNSAKSRYGSLAASITLRTVDLWHDIVCSRIGSGAKLPTLEVSHDAICSAGQTLRAGKDALTGEFLAQLWSTLVILVMAFWILQSRANWRWPIAVAVLAIVYSLSVPYAYGKLIKSTSFDYGVVRVSDALAKADQDSGTSNASFRKYALILSRDTANTKLLVAQTGKCGVGGADYETVRLSSISPSELLSVEEIYRQDVITWATLHQKRCPEQDVGPTGGTP
ncbi:MAG: hypothetical protein ABSD74_11735 [Rhizomicrobium sp.]|jgi:hypothetical protein